VLCIFVGLVGISAAGAGVEQMEQSNRQGQG
jgi:hypothetical protein